VNLQKGKKMEKKKLSRIDLQKMKEAGQTAVWITAYDYWTASFAEQASMDMILVGDSLGMCVYGYEGAVPVTMDQCIWHSEAVRCGAPNTYENLAEKTINAFKQYSAEARSGQFTKVEHAYTMIEGELQKLKERLDWSQP